MRVKCQIFFKQVPSLESCCYSLLSVPGAWLPVSWPVSVTVHSLPLLHLNTSCVTCQTCQNNSSETLVKNLNAAQSSSSLMRANTFSRLKDKMFVLSVFLNPKFRFFRALNDGQLCPDTFYLTSKITKSPYQMCFH